MMRGLLGGLLLTVMIAGAVGPIGSQPADPSVTVQMVNYSELGKVIRGLKGKVVVVDFWADF
jgi:hypothetical protein